MGWTWFVLPVGVLWLGCQVLGFAFTLGTAAWELCSDMTSLGSKNVRRIHRWRNHVFL